MTAQHWLWTGFGVLVLGALAVDLGLFQRKAHVVRPKEALIWTAVWVTMALGFGAGIWHFKGWPAANLYLTGYLVEYSLSIDNLFVFLVIFSYFGVPAKYESKILMWGIFGALVLRAVFIYFGSALMNKFAWMTYVFGGLLILTAVKLLVKKEGEDKPGENAVVRLFKRFFRVTDKMDEGRFFTRIDGKLAATPLFVTVLVVETSDVMFAVDSVPAIFAITTDPFIVYTSNVFAILGLRSLYFVVSRMMHLFRFLKYGLVVILLFVGAKLILAHHLKMPTWLSLPVIGGVLAASVVLSLLFPEKHVHEPAKEPVEGPPAAAS